MITESDIEAYILSLDNEIDDRFLQEEELLAYLTSDNIEALSEEEKKILFFCCEVIFHSYKSKHGEFPEFDPMFFQECEEYNWTTRESFDSWKECLDSYFVNYAEEDLLAFVEDTLAEESEEQSMTNIGKEIIMVVCKSYIDSITTSTTG